MARLAPVRFRSASNRSGSSGWLSPVRLGRLRARGELTELRAGDLRFTEGEAAVLLRGAAGPAAPILTGAAIEALASSG